MSAGPRTGPLLFESPLQKAKRWVRNRWVWIGVISSIMLYLGCREILQQVRLQQAIRLSRHEDYPQALALLSGIHSLFFRQRVAEALTGEARFFTELPVFKQAVKDQNWFVAERSFTIAVDCGKKLAVHDQEVSLGLEEWKAGLDRHLAAGDLAKCRSALEALGRLPLSAPGHQKQSQEIQVKTLLRLGQSYRDLESWTEALAACQDADRLKPGTPEISQLLDSIYDRMKERAWKALGNKEFERSQTLFRLLDSHFPERAQKEKRPQETIDFYKALALGEKQEKAKAFDEALSAYDDALRLSPGNQKAFGKIQALRERMQGYKKADGQWVPGSQVAIGIDFENTLKIVASSGKFPLFVNSQPNPIRNQTMNESCFTGNWSLFLDSSRPEKVWKITGNVIYRSGYSSQPVGPVEVAAMLFDKHYQPLDAKVASIPFLLPGGGDRFEIQMAHSSPAAHVAVAILGRD
ncbi:MAG: tetratricopeptide repeat protein [Planctomycetes bacterium]|nr:tetratricopeptide repeat protein [Planctomycetota bacterium]